MSFWSAFLHKRGVRKELEAVLPHEPTSPNAYVPSDVALGLMGGIVCGADKLSRVAYLRHDSAIANVLGVEAVASQSTLTRFLNLFDQQASNGLNRLHQWLWADCPAFTRAIPWTWIPGPCCTR